MFEDPSNWYIVGGLAIGGLFGLVAKHYRFCLVATVSNVSLIRDYRYALAFAATLLVAITGTQLLEILNIVDISEASYRNARLDWLGVIVGGFMFGVGATLAGGDAARIVILAGSGSKAGLLTVFFFAIMAAVAQFGILESTRVYSMMNSSINLPGEDAGIAMLLGTPKLIVLVIVDGLLLAFLISQWKRHADIKLLIAGAVLGLTVIAAWYTTGVLAVDEFSEGQSPSAMTISGPMSRIGYLFVAGQYPGFSFSIAFMLGILIISFVTAIITKKFEFTPIRGSALKVGFGASLMGIGGTLGYGCNIGQGYSGISTLSFESLLAVIAIIIGIHVTTKRLEKTL